MDDMACLSIDRAHYRNNMGLLWRLCDDGFDDLNLGLWEKILIAMNGSTIVVGLGAHTNERVRL